MLIPPPPVPLAEVDSERSQEVRSGNIVVTSSDIHRRLLDMRRVSLSCDRIEPRRHEGHEDSHEEDNHSSMGFPPMFLVMKKRLGRAAHATDFFFTAYCVGYPRRRPPRNRPVRFASTTATIRSVPVTASWLSAVMLRTPMPVRRMPSKNSAATVPKMLPRPPKMSVPPRATAVMTASSSPRARS